MKWRTHHLANSMANWWEIKNWNKPILSVGACTFASKTLLAWPESSCTGKWIRLGLQGIADLPNIPGGAHWCKNGSHACRSKTISAPFHGFFLEFYPPFYDTPFLHGITDEHSFHFCSRVPYPGQIYKDELGKYLIPKDWENVHN